MNLVVHVHLIPGVQAFFLYSCSFEGCRSISGINLEDSQHVYNPEEGGCKCETWQSSFASLVDENPYLAVELTVLQVHFLLLPGIQQFY